MRIIIVRHGDPDYSIDSLTEKGWREAELLQPRIKEFGAVAYYMSPLGRAKDTAHTALKGTGIEPEIKDWLREFGPQIRRPDRAEIRTSLCWDWLPQDWTLRDNFYRYDKWLEEPEMVDGRVKEEYEWVCQGLEEILNKHGYKKEGRYFRAERPNNDTIVMFCHFGVTCVMLSYLLNASPMVLWQGFATAPTSITSVYTEERREGIASFRVSAMGDVSHLYKMGEEPSFSARFCECYKNTEERHD